LLLHPLAILVLFKIFMTILAYFGILCVTYLSRGKQNHGICISDEHCAQMPNTHQQLRKHE